MPVTAPDMVRLTRIALLAAVALVADSRQDVVDVFAAMAGALSESNPASFMKFCDPSMANYAELERAMTALANQNEIASSVEFVSQEGDDLKQTVELDWLIEARTKNEGGLLVRRRSNIKCRLERRKKKWIVVSLEPVQFFAPPPVTSSAKKQADKLRGRSSSRIRAAEHSRGYE